MGEAISVASTVAVAIFDCLYANKSSVKTHRKIEHSSMYSTPSPSSSLLFFLLFSVDRVGNRDPKRMRKYWEWWEEIAATMLVPKKRQPRSTQKLFSNHTHFSRRSIHTEFHISLAPNQPPSVRSAIFQCIRKQNTHEQQCETEKKAHTNNSCTRLYIYAIFWENRKNSLQSKIAAVCAIFHFFCSLLLVLAMTFFLWLFHLCVTCFFARYLREYCSLDSFVQLSIRSMAELNFHFTISLLHTLNAFIW